MKIITEILGVRIDNFSIEEIKENILYILGKNPEQKFIATLNPEILLKAHRDKNYRDILNSADLNICDGFGIRIVSFLRNKSIKARFSGADLADFLLEKASENSLRVVIIASNNSLSEPGEIEREIKKKYPSLWIKADYLPNDAIINSAEVIFVNFGAPEQEKFIFENREKFPNAKILIGVGGTFDFLTGKIRRAPRFLRSLGLEWLWRLIQQPKRLRRIINAVIIFPLVALMKRD
jgi:N-acetylglucosaminyldiphosphoundecaprenol N-acetyl-beta-D-mannosaminyltransferase